MGRIKSATRNIAFGFIGQAATLILSFALRTIFIMHLSEDLLGVNSMYSNILSLLNMAELGIGTALNFSLYGPVARGEKEKIKSYMQLYRKAYRVIATVVAVVGLLLVPFLKYLAKNPGDVSERDLTLYYLIFLFNTVSSYFVAYKYSLVNAEQKNYIQTNILTITKIITVSIQIAVVVITENFYLFLLTDAAVQLVQKVFVSIYLDKKYPLLKEKNIEPLAKAESDEVWNKTKALVFHKVGDVARLQTDAIIITSFIQVKMAGYVDNYNLVLNSVSNFVNIIFNSVISSFGNLIATESKQKQYEMFKVYRFFASWIYGYSCVGFMILLTPLIRIWIGDKWVLVPAAVYCILTDYYFKGDRIVLSNYKTAAGVFEQDKYLALIQGAVNLVLSIALVQTPLGIVGIYIGTIVSGLIANITKPIIIYRACFDMDASSYFIDSFKYIASLLFVLLSCHFISLKVLSNLNIFTFLIMAVIITIVFNGVYFILYGRSEEFKYLYGKLREKLVRH
ncbi:Membrane protein involved in the export of O-antigen and teichoic acid [Butyrivibrio hungatei DSM 14810]|uniref:Membrane protein involved in the export of O-antigen and teichoic acid n=1 Tax=Butyrivibrio hungatei DSM 14810 TaxID=1121132 RepID=A0A1M7RZM7_9FIRM|nr:polysaccharide biosynthesis protein [Butyrivibrio hungatei]SHN51638.1 Membrane protein involved in the export of O-antigen and teichoic acid [Butyrivibrio hungatei DSM 14810]